MGWSYGVVNDREVGYAVEAVCDLDGCNTAIDRGLAYCCGGMHGSNDYGCAGYFCSAHLFIGEAPHFVCESCLDAYPEGAQ